MVLWRLALGSYPALDGEGARRYGGRWNDPGIPITYLSEHPALCLVETLVNLDEDQIPMGYTLYCVEGPAPARLPDQALSPDWRDDIETTRRAVRTWIEESHGLLLSVPSAVVPRSRNILLNPRHPEAAEMSVVEEIPFSFDARLL